MSAYITMQTPMTDRELLLEALADLGYDAGKVEVRDEPVALVGYVGDARADRADVVIRRSHIGGGSNDVGFLATPTGYLAIISDYDRGRFGTAWVAKLHERYRVRAAAKEERLAAAERERLAEERRRLVAAQRDAVVAQAKKLGYRVNESRQGEAVRLVLVRRSY